VVASRIPATASSTCTTTWTAGNWPAHPAVAAGLGVTAVELMPVHQFISERPLAAAGRSNYWGYNTIAFLAPHNRYSSSSEPHGQVTEFKSMVKSLHGRASR
jgi:isoamylase